MNEGNMQRLIKRKEIDYVIEFSSKDCSEHVKLCLELHGVKKDKEKVIMSYMETARKKLKKILAD